MERFMKGLKLILLLSLFFLAACSAAYEQVKEIDTKNPKNFKEHHLYNYKSIGHVFHQIYNYQLQIFGHLYNNL